MIRVLKIRTNAGYSKFLIQLTLKKERLSEVSAQKKDAQKAEIKWLEEHKGISENPPEIFDEVIERFLKHCESTCTKQTKQNYEGFYKNHLQYFQGVKIEKLTPVFIQGWYDSKIKTVSPYLMNNCRKLLKASFNFAIKLQLLSKNPFDILEHTKEFKKHPKRFSLAELKRLLPICREKVPEFYLMFAFATLTGMRCSEFLCTRKEKIDFEKLEYPVTEQYYRGEIKKTKTESSTRIIGFGMIVKEAIEFHCRKYGIFSGFLFPSGNKKGFPVSYRTVERGFEKLLEIAGYDKKYMKLHNLRGEFVDIQQSQNIPTKEISRQVGHSSTRITNDVYSYILNETKEEAKFAADRALGYEG